MSLPLIRSGAQGKPRLAVVAVTSGAGELGGAERFYSGLSQCLATDELEVDLLKVVSNELSFEEIKASYLRFYNLDLSDYDAVVSTKAPSYAVRHPNHVSYLLHTMRVFYDMFEREFPEPWPELLEHRALIQELDTCCLSPPYTRKVLCYEEVRQRLRQYNGLDAELLHHDTYGPLSASHRSDHRPGDYRYVFLPGRLHRWKRVQLVIEAMNYVEAPVELRIAGSGEDESHFRKLAQNDPRISFVGVVPEDRLLQLYQDALVVPFVPLREDFGLVTVEAFRAFKPVITCADSGEPTRLVQDGQSGFVCPSNPEIIAKKIQLLYENPDLARRMGENGYRSVEYITWERVRSRLLSALRLY